MAALKRGVDPDSTSYVSKPLKFKDPEWGPIEVKTYDNSYRGSISLTRATLSSDNSVYTQLALDLGPREIRQTAYDMGITSKLEGLPAETLGGLKIGVSPLEMANAYATIASGGYRNRPIAITSIRTRAGEVLKGKDLPAKLRPKRVKAFSAGVTAEATRLLEMNVKQGTGTKAQIGCPAAGKTGTTDKHSDAWFVGFTPKLATSVWVGYPKAQIYMTSEYGGGPVAGGTYPAEIWGDYMRVATGERSCGSWKKGTFERRPFFGKYASGQANTGPGDYGSQTNAHSAPGYTAPAPATDGDDGGGTDGGGGGGGDGGGGDGGGTARGNADEGFDPDLYESPPQPPPTAGGAPAGDG